MEIAAAHHQSLTCSSVRLSSTFHARKFSSYSVCKSLTSSGFPQIGRLTLEQQCGGVGIKPRIGLNPRGKSGFIPLSSNQPSSGGSSGADDGWKWLLEPIGDGEWKHIGVKVARPGAYEIVSSSVTVGRVPDKADLVIPVATVSGLHARMQKRDGNLYISDLGSTNGTYVNERRVNPGEILPVVPGDRVTFGDTHLAIFIVSKLENVVKQEAVGEEENVQVAAETQSSPSA